MTGEKQHSLPDALWKSMARDVNHGVEYRVVTLTGDFSGTLMELAMFPPGAPNQDYLVVGSRKGSTIVLRDEVRAVERQGTPLYVSADERPEAA